MDTKKERNVPAGLLGPFQKALMGLNIACAKKLKAMRDKIDTDGHGLGERVGHLFSPCDLGYEFIVHGNNFGKYIEADLGEHLKNIPLIRTAQGLRESFELIEKAFAGLRLADQTVNFTDSLKTLPKESAMHWLVSQMPSGDPSGMGGLGETIGKLRLDIAIFELRDELREVLRQAESPGDRPVTVEKKPRAV